MKQLPAQNASIHHNQRCTLHALARTVKVGIDVRLLVLSHSILLGCSSIKACYHLPEKKRENREIEIR